MYPTAPTVYQLRHNTILHLSNLNMLVSAFGVFALAATTLAVPFIEVKNKCGSDVWVTSVGTQPGNTNKVPNTKSWKEDQYFSGVGTAIKITRTADGLYNSRPVLHLSYTYSPDRIYYGLSTVFGYDFQGKKITVQGDANEGVPSIQWDATNQPSGTLAYVGTTNLTLVLCA